MRWWLGLIAVALACSSKAELRATDPPVAGVVVDGLGRALPGRRVYVGSAETTTDIEGRFTLAHVPRVFDVAIFATDRRHFTIYKGLSRRDPTLVHLDEAETAPSRNRVTISGRLVGGGPYPLEDTMHVQFSSPRASSDIMLGGLGAPNSTGPEWGPLVVEWEGAPTLSGELLALEIGNEEGSSSWFGRQAMTLQAGHAVTASITMVKAPTVERPAVPVQVTAPRGFGADAVHEQLALPGRGVVFSAGRGRLGEPYLSVDLTGFGFIACQWTIARSSYARAHVRRCGSPGPLYAPPAPAVRSPSFGAQAGVGTTFEWSRVPAAVYRLKIQPQEKAEPSIHLVTTETRATWPSLQAFGVAGPVPPTVYTATVTAIGPWNTPSDAFGPSGLGDSLPSERWASESTDVGLRVYRPARPEVASCHSQADFITCDDPPRYGEGANNFVLSAINEILRCYPDFADFSPVKCVVDCRSAREFLKAYEAYEAAHPGFRDNQPLPPQQVPLPPQFE